MARYIDTDVMKDDIIKLRRTLDTDKCSNDFACGWVIGVDNMEGLIDRQPTAEVEEVNHGYWIEGSKYKMNYSQVYRYYTCSNCRFTWELFEGAQKEFKRCPYCEFKMDMETKREDDLV